MRYVYNYTLHTTINFVLALKNIKAEGSKNLKHLRYYLPFSNCSEMKHIHCFFFKNIKVRLFVVTQNSAIIEKLTL